MPLPALPDHYHDQAYKLLVDLLPFKWFHQLEHETSPLYPYLKGLALAIAYARYAREQALEASIPMRSEGIWLTLHLDSIGLQRRQSESVEDARDRYQWEFKQTRNTRTGELLALEHFMGLSPPTLRIETDRQTGRLGQFRLVLDSETLPWADVDFSFLGEFIGRYVSNGIIPSIDIGLQCLIVSNLPYFKFSSQFSMGFNQLRPFWETPVFINSLRLDFARSMVAQVSAAEWRADQDRLLQLHADAKQSAPGAVFVYLSDRNPCPYLLADVPITGLADDNIAQQAIKFAGFKHYHHFPRIGPALAFSLDAPPLLVIVPTLYVSVEPATVDLPPLDTLNNTEGLSSDLITVHYYGIGFTRRQITEFIVNEDAIASTALEGSRDWRWTLALTEGNSNWGNFPPAGTARVQEPFTVLKLNTSYWTDESGDRRASFPASDEEGNIYLALEFLYPKQAARTIREIELRWRTDSDESDTVAHYRRLAFPLGSTVNGGFLFKLRMHDAG